MSLVFRRRFKGPWGSQVTLSTGGLTWTKTFGNRLTVNSHGDISLRLFRGLVWRIRG
jgi:hypothetical protein